MTTERMDLIRAVLTSRDEIAPGFDNDLLEAIVDSEAEAAGNAEAAMNGIRAAVTAALERGVDRWEAGEPAVGSGDDDDEER